MNISSIYGIYAQTYTEIINDYKEIRKRLSPPAEMYTPENASALAGLPNSFDMSIFEMNTRRSIPDMPTYVTRVTIQDKPASFELKPKRDIQTEPSIFTQAQEVEKKEEKKKLEPKDWNFKYVPISTRIKNVIDEFKEGDYLTGITMAGLATMFGPEDLRDVFSAYDQIKAISERIKYKGDYDYKNTELPASFFRGSIIHKKMNPFTPNSKFKNVKMWLLGKDKSLIETEFGEKFLNKFGIDIETFDTDVDEIIQKGNLPVKVKSYKFITNSKVAKLAARTMTRVPVIGAIVDAGVECMQAAHDIKMGEKPAEAVCEAVVRFGTSTVITAIAGAVGSTFGPLGTLGGITIANVLNSKIAEAID